MIKKLLPVILALLGAGAGVGAGMALRPAPPPLSPEEAEKIAKAAAEAAALDPENQPEYVKLNNQFIVPVVHQGKVTAMVILALSLEVKKESSSVIFSREPKLRDSFLQVMFEHANAGGFDGSFTDGDNLVILRSNLRDAAQRVLGDIVIDVLINDIARQDSH